MCILYSTTDSGQGDRLLATDKQRLTVRERNIAKRLMLQQSKIILFLVLVLLGSNFLFATPSPLPREQAVSITPSTPVVSTDPQALCCSFQRKTFFAEGIYWLFYSDGSNIECVTSPDALVWSQPTSIASSGGDGNLWSTWVNATSNTLFYARVSGSLFFYRFGTLSSLGCAQISWQIPETSESPANLGQENYIFISAVSPENFWVSLSTTDTRGFVHLELWKYTGSWTKTYDFNTSSTNQEASAILPLSSDQKWVYVYGPVSTSGKISIISTSDGGASWSKTVTTVDSASSFAKSSEITFGDTLGVLYPTSSNIEYVTYSLGGLLSPRVTVDSSDGQVLGTALSLDESAGKLVAFFSNSTAVFYKVSLTVTSPNWSARVEIAGSTGSLSTDNSIRSGPSSSYFASNNFSTIAWVNGTSSPFELRFVSVSLLVSQPISLSAATLVQPSMYGNWTLAGCGISLGSAAVQGDGKTRTVSVWPGCALSVILPSGGGEGVRYSFPQNETLWTITTCKIGTCSTSKNSYYLQFLVVLSGFESANYSYFGKSTAAISPEGVWVDSGGSIMGGILPHNWTIIAPSHLYEVPGVGFQILSNSSLSSLVWNSTLNELDYSSAVPSSAQLYFAPSLGLVPVSEYENDAQIAVPTVSPNVIELNGSSGTFRVQFANLSCTHCYNPTKIPLPQTSQEFKENGGIISKLFERLQMYVPIISKSNELILVAVVIATLSISCFVMLRKFRRSWRNYR